MSPFRQPLTPEKALERMEALCARAEHSSAEILRKLRTLGLSAADADAVVASLVKNRYVDDDRFARAYVRDKFRFARWGRLKIRLGLVQKGISHHSIESAMAEIDPAEYGASLRHLLIRKASTLEGPATNYENRMKLMRAAASRGFEPRLIAHVLDTWKDTWQNTGEDTSDDSQDPCDD